MWRRSSRRYGTRGYGVAAPEAIEDLERALGKADRPRPGGQGVVVVEQYDRNFALGEVDGQRQSYRPRPDHHRGAPYRPGRGLVGVTGIVEDQLLIVDVSRSALASSLSCMTCLSRLLNLLLTNGFAI